MFEYHSFVDVKATKIIVHAINFHTILLDQYESSVVMFLLYFASSSNMYGTERKLSLKWHFNMSPNPKVSYHV